jgi:hypothetical protein
MFCFLVISFWHGKERRQASASLFSLRTVHTYRGSHLHSGCKVGWSSPKWNSIMGQHCRCSCAAVCESWPRRTNPRPEPSGCDHTRATKHHPSKRWQNTRQAICECSCQKTTFISNSGSHAFIGSSLKLSHQALVVHTFNPSTREAETGGFLSSRPAWSTEWVPE